MTSAFSRILLFVALSLWGLVVIPKLSLQWQPDRHLPSLSLSYQWPGASAQLVEQQVTSRLEAMLVRLKDIRRLTSTSENGRGTIRIEVDPEVDLDYFRLEVSNLLRQLRPELPTDLSYPRVERNRPQTDSDPHLLSYTLSGPDAPEQLRTYAAEHLQPRLALVDGIHQISLYGATPFAWELSYAFPQLQSLGLDQTDLAQALQNAWFQEEIGQLPLSPQSPILTRVWLQSQSVDQLGWTQSPVQMLGNRLIRLDDLVEARHRERPPRQYHRINGLQTIHMNVLAKPSANQIAVAKAFRAEVAALRANLPPGYELLLTYDATVFLQAELTNIGWRSLLSLSLLLLLVWGISGSWRYVLVLSISLFANLSIAIWVYHLLGLDIHLYSLAGITVSFGLLIDNSIVMIDHLRREANRAAFGAILAATLTTLGALSILFFLSEAQRLLLADFAWVLLINLSISLAVAYWLSPALASKLALTRQISSPPASWQWLQPMGQWLIRFRKWLILLAVLGFGLPTFWLPDQWEREKEETESPVYVRWYNQTIGSRTYQQDLKPWVDALLGGSLRLFAEETYANARFQEASRTALHVRGEMPYGCTLAQMNAIMKRMENFLSQYEEIAQFQTDIQSPQAARIRIFFSQEATQTNFPLVLQSRLERFAMDQGAVDWRIFGTGPMFEGVLGFSNRIGMGGKNSRIILRGYNYDQLLQYAHRIGDSLIAHPRIKEVFFNGKYRFDYRPHDRYELKLNLHRLAELGLSPRAVYEQISRLSLAEQPVLTTHVDGKYEAMVLRPKEQASLDLWEVWQWPLSRPEGGSFKLAEVAKLQKVPAGDFIYRENQQYRLYLEYDFIGPNRLQWQVNKAIVEAANQWLPLGFLAESQGFRNWGQDDERKQYLLLGVVILIIYGICAMLLESWRLPLAIIGMIPLSFIGLFLTFHLFSLPFDQGGYAAFLILSGITVNSALYILYEYQWQVQQRRNQVNQIAPSLRWVCYWQAFQVKIYPISVTVFSTVVGLIPFLLGETTEPFWFSLAAGTIGGLLFSMLAICVYLPIFSLKKP